jgi:hypothetical protein
MTSRHRQIIACRTRVAALVPAIVLAIAPVVHASRVLFDASKGEMSGNADWVIDSDAELNGHSNPARFPTPAQSGITATTPETYWKGGISAWGVTMVKHGNSVESLPRASTITYGNTANAQDLSRYKSFVVCEPNNLFSMSEKTAIVNFVRDGGGLFIVADHNGSDRDNDGVDSVDVWNDLFTNNGVTNNVFGMAVNYNNISATSSNLNPASPFNAGAEGTATSLAFHAGATFTISGATRAAVWTTGSQTNSNVMMAHANYGLGRIVALGDSSPADDGTGDTSDDLFFGWDEASDGVLISNATDWLHASPQTAYTLSTGGSWANADAWTGGVPTSTATIADFRNTLSADATITLGQARSAAAIRFDSVRSYTLSGSDPITFASSPTLTVMPGVIVTQGSHTITAPLIMPFRGEFNVIPAASTLTVGRVSAATSGGLNKAGAGRLHLTRLTGSIFNVSAGVVRFTGTDPAAPASRVFGLGISSGATVDLGRSSLIIDYSGTVGALLATTKGHITAGRLLTTDAGLAIGYAEASVLGVTSFGGEAVDGTALLLRATKPGDANLDLTTNFADLVLLAKSYNQAGNWSEGDFDYSGTVDFADLVRLAQNYNTSAAAVASITGAASGFAADWALAQSLVPEPTALLALVPLAVMARRCR